MSQCVKSLIKDQRKCVFNLNRVVIYCNTCDTWHSAWVICWKNWPCDPNPRPRVGQPTRWGTFLGHVGQVVEARRREKTVSWDHRDDRTPVLNCSLILSTLCVSLALFSLQLHGMKSLWMICFAARWRFYYGCFPVMWPCCRSICMCMCVSDTWISRCNELQF